MYREKVRPEVEKLAWAKYKYLGRQDKVRPEVERAAWAVPRATYRPEVGPPTIRTSYPTITQHVMVTGTLQLCSKLTIQRECLRYDPYLCEIITQGF